MENKYTPEQIADIKEREEKALKALTDLQLNPSAIVQKVNIGQDVFADKVIPYLQDLKYANPETPSDPAPEIEEPVEA